MTPSEQADELVAISKLVRKGGRAGTSDSPERKVDALAALSEAAVRLIPVQRELADTRDLATLAAIRDGWGQAASLASRLGVTAQAVSKWRKRGERLIAGKAD